MKFSTKKLVYMAVLVAISIILTRMFGMMLPVGGAMVIRLSFGEIPIIMAGLLLGPLAGALTGVAADLLGFMINSFGGPYFPGFTLTAALTGALPALILRHVREKGFSWKQLLVAILITDIITSVIMNTMWLHIMYNKALAVILPPRIIARAMLIPVYTMIIYTMTKHPVLAPWSSKPSTQRIS